MLAVSPVKYAKAGEAYVAYRVAGRGHPVVLINDWFSHMGEMWEPASPFLAILNELASNFRLITFDKRGVGLSDPLDSPFLPTIEDWSADVMAVLDAEGIERASLLGKGSGGAMALMAAAAFPERIDKLVLISAWARLTKADDFPIGADSALAESLVTEPYMSHGSIRVLLGKADPALENWLDRYAHSAAGPGLTMRMRRWLLTVDVRPALGIIQVPTLIVSRQYGWIGADQAQYLADAIAGSELVILPGSSDYLFAGDFPAMLDPAVTFLGAATAEHSTDRVLKATLFTDVVGSTERASVLGDERWRHLLNQHDLVIREAASHWSGQWIKHTGDGVLLMFDGPARALRCATQIRNRLHTASIQIRCGVHAGEVELRGSEFSGLAIHIGARVMAAAGADEIVASRTVRDLVMGGGFEWIDLGPKTLKGVADTWNLYRLADWEL